MISLLLSLSLAWAHAADSCSTVDLRDKLGPVRDQGPLDACYAYMAADLLGASTKPALKSPVSAIHVAANFASRTRPSAKTAARHTEIIEWESETTAREDNFQSFKDLHGKGFVDRVNDGALQLSAVVAESFEKPLCLESELPSEPGNRRIHDLKERLESDLPAPEGADADQEEYKFLYNSMREAEASLVPKKDMIKCDLQEKLHPAPLLKFSSRELSPAVYNWAAPQIATKMAEKCKMKITIPAAKVRDAYFQEMGNYEVKLLNTQLSKGNPVGIGYTICDFMKMRDEGSGCGHASTVAGRRRNPQTGSCEYLIRNSYGASCEDYRKGVKCEKGYFWASEAKLKKSTNELTWVDREAKP